MTDIATLGIRVDSSQLDDGTRALDRLGDQATATGAQVTRASAGMTRGFGATGTALQRMRPQIQNASFQFQDIITQMQMGTRASVVFGQQLPQLAGGFGAIGAAAGVGLSLAAVAFGPLIDRLFTAEGGVADLEAKIDDLSGAFKNLQQAQDLSRTSIDGLIDRYGVMNEQVLSIVRGLERAALTSFQTAVQEAIQGFDDLDGELGDALSMLQTIETVGGNRIRGLAARFDELPPAIRAAAAEVQNFATSGQEDLAVQRDRALEAAAALEALNDAEYSQAIAALYGFADVATQQLGRVSAEARNARNALNMTTGSLFSDIIGDDGQMRPASELLFGGLPGDIPASSRRGGGGGGRSGAAEVTAEMRAADRAIRQAQEAAVQFSDVQEVLNQRLADGSISLETYNAALEGARERYTQVGEASQFWQQQQDTLKNGILDAIVAGDDLADTFENLARSIARAALEAALFGTGPFAEGSGLLGGLFGNIFSTAPGGSVNGGTSLFARGGVVSGATPFAFGGGKLGVMGEAGPEAILPLSRGPGGKLGVNASGSAAPVNVVVNNYSSEQADVRHNGQDIEVIIGRVISKDIQSGGPTYRAMRKTFGLRQPVTTRG